MTTPELVPWLLALVRVVAASPETPHVLLFLVEGVGLGGVLRGHRERRYRRHGRHGIHRSVHGVCDTRKNLDPRLTAALRRMTPIPNDCSGLHLTEEWVARKVRVAAPRGPEGNAVIIDPTTGATVLRLLGPCAGTLSLLSGLGLGGGFGGSRGGPTVPAERPTRLVVGEIYIVPTAFSPAPDIFLGKLRSA